MIRFTPDARLLAAPFRTYHVLARQSGRSRAGDWTRVLARVALCAAIAGTATAAAATGRISWSLALSGTACWFPLIALQLLTAAAVIIPVWAHPGTLAPSHPGTLAPSHRGTLAPRHLGTLMRLFFHAQAPWSLWVLVACAFAFAAPELASDDLIMASAPAPFAWTAVLVYAYFREVTGLRRRPAVMATLAHQTMTAAVIVAYIAWAVQLWPRLLALGLP